MVIIRYVCALLFAAALLGGLTGCTTTSEYARNNPPGPFDRYTGERIPANEENAQYWGYPHEQ